MERRALVKILGGGKLEREGQREASNDGDGDGDVGGEGLLLTYGSASMPWHEYEIWSRCAARRDMLATSARASSP